MDNENDLRKLHHACDMISDHSLSIEAKSEAIATEARELKDRAERIKGGNASYDDIVALQSAVSEMDHVLHGDLDRALSTLRAVRLS